MTKEESIDLCAAYALEALESEELRRFEEYLRTAGPEEIRQLQEFVSVASMLPLVLERKAPPSHVKEDLIRKIQLSAHAQESAERRTESFIGVQPVPRRNLLWIGVAAVAIVMVIGFSIFVSRLMGTIEYQNQQLVASNKSAQELQKRLVALKDELTQKEELLRVLSSKRIEITVMNGLQVNPVGYGKIIWDPEKRTAILQVSNLPAVPSNKDYQLWVIKDKKPISAGVFAVADTSASFFKIENLAVTNPKEIAAFAITLEPKGGVPAPTGDMYMAGSPKL